MSGAEGPARSAERHCVMQTGFGTLFFEQAEQDILFTELDEALKTIRRPSSSTPPAT